MFKFTQNYISNRAKRAVVGVSSLCLISLLSLNTHAQDLNVDINKSQVLRLPAAASAVVVGNPMIADVSIHSPDTLFIVARGFGETNVIILDEFGATMMNANIHVGYNRIASSKRAFHNNAGWRTYDCKPFCQAAPILSDELPHKVQFLPQVQPIDNSATPIRASQGSGISSAPGAPSVLNSTRSGSEDYQPVDSSGSFNSQMQQGQSDYGAGSGNEYN